MARKRVSLKDKGPETLGLNEKKGKGIDVLLGGPIASQTRLASSSTVTKSKATNTEGINMAAENQNNLTNVPSSVSGPIGSAESLPVNEADSETHFSAATQPDDDLGLPVALELPPSRLTRNLNIAREVDDLGLPVAMDAPPPDLVLAVPAPPPPIDTSTLVAAPVDEVASIITDDNDLSGLASEVENTVVSAPAIDTAPPSFSEAPVEPAPIEPYPPVISPSDTDIPVPPVAPSPIDAAPADVFTPEPLMGKPDPALSSAPAPIYAPAPAPYYASSAPVVAVPQPVIQSVGGIITEALPSRIEDLLPADYQYATSAIQVAERSRLERDDLLSEKVERYLGAERRQTLDKEIERLYEVVSNELSDNNEDVSFALKALSEAQDIILEDIRQYDEALYRVALVKTMLVRRRNLKQWSYSWGLFVFAYAVFWLVLFILAIVFTGNINTAVGSFAGESGGLAAGRSAWYSALAGGIGGIIGILYSLYWRVAVKQNFDRQYIMYYLVQPIMGFMLGAVTHLIITAGFLTFNAAGATSQITVILQMVIGFVAGFRQRVVYEMIDRIVQKIAPEEPDRNPISVIPEQ
jgi:hypothetical protein